MPAYPALLAVGLFAQRYTFSRIAGYPGHNSIPGSAAKIHNAPSSSLLALARRMDFGGISRCNCVRYTLPVSSHGIPPFVAAEARFTGLCFASPPLARINRYRHFGPRS